GQVDVIAESGNGLDGLDDGGAEVAGMGSGETHALDAGNFRDGGEEFGEGALPCRIFVGIYVLAEELNFAVAEIGHLAGFGKDGAGSAAALFAAGEGNDAVGAEFVAAFDDGDVSAMRVAARGEVGFEALVGLTIVETG